MKDIVNKIIGIVAIVAIGATIWLAVANHNNRKDLERSRINEKALIDQIDEDEKQSRVFIATIDELEQSNDSISQSLLETKKALKIKDKEVAGLQKMISEFSKKDTIRLVDTIFKDPTVNIDTLIGDEWLSNHLELSYPNNICIDTKVRSDKDVILTMTKETVNPPKKCFIGRWFQKKQHVLKAVVSEKNPYITSETNVFIKTVK